MSDEITELLTHHWHIVRYGDDRLTIEGHDDPCVRSDGSFFLLPAVGPLGVEIAARLRQPSGRDAAVASAQEALRQMLLDDYPEPT